jgi:putative ABC transport system permease protein
MLLLTVRDLQFRATRFVVVVLAAGVVFGLLLLMTGLVAQFEREPRQTVAAFGGSGWVATKGASGVFTSAGTLSPAAVKAIVVDGHKTATVVARHSMRANGADHDVFLAGLPRRGLGRPATSEGRLPESPSEIAIADAADVAVGDTIVVGGRELTVSGLVPEATLLAGMPVVFMPVAEVRDLLFQGRPVTTTVLIDGEVLALPASLQVLSNAEVAADVRRPLERPISTLHLVRFLLLLVAGMVMGAVIYLSALERRRDFAVLKAVGASGRSLLGGLAVQGVLVAAGASAVAIALTLALRPVFPLNVHLSTSAIASLPPLAVVVALVGSVAGLRRVQRADPATAFAGQGG